MNDSLDDNEDVYSNNSKEKSKDIETHPAYLIMSSPLGNHKIDKVVFTRLGLGTSIFKYCFTLNVSPPVVVNVVIQ